MGNDPNRGDEIGEAARKRAAELIAARRRADDARAARADADNKAKLDVYRERLGRI